MAIAKHPLDPLVDVMARLRGEGGCPWDREQTHESLRPYVIEEAYEVAEAIDSGDPQALCEELGDLLLQVVFHAQIARESGKWDIDDCIRAVVDKMIRRHPHVFGDAVAEDSAAVLAQWERIKAAERKEPASRLGDIPKSLPALQSAERLQQRAAEAGFDWDSAEGAFEKVAEEIQEVREACKRADSQDLAAEWGDLLFALVNVGRHLRIDSEQALRRANEKFRRRFAQMEAQAASDGLDLARMSLSELDALWEKAKAQEASDRSGRPSGGE